MDASERTGRRMVSAGVACTLVIDGRVIEFVLDGPLVAMAPAGEKTAKRPSTRGSK